jgi:hypothetical protein
MKSEKKVERAARLRNKQRWKEGKKGVKQQNPENA